MSKRERSRSNSSAIHLEARHGNCDNEKLPSKACDELVVNQEETIVSKLKELKKPPESLCEEARRVWLNASSNVDLILSERLYKRFLRYVDRRLDAEKNPFTPSELCFIDEQKKVLLLLLTQMSNREDEVKSMLSKEGYVARLARGILNYPLFDALVTVDTSTVDTKACPCVAVDNVLDQKSFGVLQSVFLPTDSDYWTSHDYCVEPPSPFFSYVIPLSEAHTMGPLGKLALAVKETAEKYFPNAPKALYGEVWSHNRPHAVGHQLHFDSDDEGRGGIRNPVLGSIFYISGGSGGPSIVTNQPVGAKELATKGWMCQPKQNRLVVFNGKMLHGVIPGKGTPPPHEDGENTQNRRVTLMVALWPDIKIRREKKPGSARPLPSIDDPSDAPNGQEWLQVLRNVGGDATTLAAPQERPVKQPIPVKPVWEKVDGSVWPDGSPIPHYDLVFQGF